MASIQKRGESSFLLVVEAGYKPNGKRNKRTKTIKIEDKALLKTKKRLREFLESELHKFKIEVEAGEYIAPEKMKLNDFVEEWRVKYAEKELAETTQDNYNNHLKNHVLPAIGHMRIDEIKPIHIINLLNSLKRKNGDQPLSGRSKQDVYVAIRVVFERAYQWKIIKSNPVADVKKPKDTKSVKDDEINVYDEDEVALLFNAVSKEPFHWRIFTTLALAAGLRRSELNGLEWSKIDLDEGIIQVNQVIVRGKNGPVIKGPKSRSSKRIVSLPSSVVEELKLYRKHWLMERMKVGDLWIEKEHEFLFCNVDGTHFYPTVPTTWWRRFIKRCGIRYIRLHDLRHTSATLLINQGVHAKIISERLGHSDIRITMNTYGHALQKADKEAAEKLNNLFEQKA